jgi:hypothetical protein
MLNDPIVDEIHQFRAQLLEEHGGNLAAYFAALIQKQQQHPERYVSFVNTGAAPEKPQVGALASLTLPLFPTR